MAANHSRLICAILALAIPAPAGAVGVDGQRSGWEQLHLSRTAIGETTVYYEKVLEPNLPIFEREFKKLLAERDRAADVVGKKEEIVADINRILGAVDANSVRQGEMLATLTGSLTNMKLTLYLAKKPTIKDFLRTGGQLPSFSYDRATDTALYNPQIHWASGEEPPEAFELCIPIAPDKDFGEYISEMLPALRHFLGGVTMDVASSCCGRLIWIS